MSFWKDWLRGTSPIHFPRNSKVNRTWHFKIYIRKSVKEIEEWGLKILTSTTFKKRETERAWMGETQSWNTAIWMDLGDKRMWRTQPPLRGSGWGPEIVRWQNVEFWNKARAWGIVALWRRATSLWAPRFLQIPGLVPMSPSHEMLSLLLSGSC